MKKVPILFCYVKKVPIFVLLFVQTAQSKNKLKQLNLNKQMQTHLKGNGGKPEEYQGKTEAIIVPISLAHKLEEYVEENDIVDEHWVLKTFRITKKTLCNYITSRKIPSCDYTVAFNNTKFFFRSRLLGLKNLLTSRKKIA